MRIQKKISGEVAKVLVLLAAASGVPIGLTAAAVVQEVTVEVVYPLAWSCVVSVNGQSPSTYTGIGGQNAEFTLYNVHKLSATCTATDTSYTYSICIVLRDSRGQTMESPCVPYNTSRTVTATWPP